MTNLVMLIPAKMDSFGEYIKNIRLKRGLLLREVAAGLEIDPSFLSRIEGNTKRPTRDHVVLLAAILQTNENEMLVAYLSERIVYELQGERLAMKAMSVAERKIKYLALRNAPKNIIKK